MAKGKLKIHTENILPIIKKWLYSDKDIFLRELVSNACDAMSKLKILRDAGEATFTDSELRIDITLDPEAKTLTIADGGIGMSAKEVENYIAQLAFSGAEEFLGKYKSQNEEDQIIGHFGLGFYSAYMVASHVDIDTLSYRSDTPAAAWSCDGSTDYTLEEGKRAIRGTTITLHIAEDSEEFLEESRIKQILQQYCAFLPFPIHLNGNHINKQEPLWVKPASACTDQEYLEFYRSLYPFEPDPVFWVHINVDYPFHVKGILYFPKLQKRFEWDKNTIKLFCNRVFVSDNCKDLIPDYLMILRGAIDSPDIPLNVSRSYLQMDRTVRQLASHVSKKVADRLANLYLNEREKFLQCWSDIEMIVKLGILQDEKFYERAKDFLVWKNLKNEWTTLEEYLARNKEAYKEKIFYTTEEKFSGPLVDLYRERNIEILQANSHVDAALMSYLERKLSPVAFQRIDGKLDDAILDASREKTLLDASGKTESVHIADFFRSRLSAQPSLEVEAKSLASDSLPAFLVVDEESRRLRDYMAISGQALAGSFPQKKTFVLNTNNRLIHAIYGLKDKNPELAADMSTHLYELSLLAQKELDPSTLSDFVQRSARVLEKLVNP